jgi:hypothetical protein
VKAGIMRQKGCQKNRIPRMKSKFIRLNENRIQKIFYYSATFQQKLSITVQHPRNQKKFSTTVQHPGINLSKNKMAAKACL